jgi:hypothetical protein
MSRDERRKFFNTIVIEKRVTKTRSSLKAALDEGEVRKR